MEHKDIRKPVDNYDWVIYLAGEWEQFFKRHLIRELARQLPHSRILCVARPICLLTGLLRQPREFLSWLKQRERITALDKNLLHIRPSILLHDHLAAHISLAKRINRLWLKHQLHVAIEQAGLRWGQLIVLIYDPFQLEYLGLVGELLSIYDRYDEYTALSEVPFLRTRDQVLKREQLVLEQVDLVFAASEMIRRPVEKVHRRVYVVPNAADTQNLMMATAQETEMADEIASIPKPIVGYVGTINERTDFQLVVNIARSRPDWSLVFVGPYVPQYKSFFSSRSFQEAKRLSSVFFLGAVPYERLPNYLKAFDVCIVPYAINEFNQSCSPLKIYEYLATGKPIVTTDLPGVRIFREVIRIAADHNSFVEQIEEALRENNIELIKRRLAIAQLNSWDARAETIINIIDAQLRK